MLLTRRSILAALCVLALGTNAIPSPLAAQTIDQLRASGAIGERYDGLLLARESGYDDVVAKVNAKRLTIYQKKATKEGVSVEAVGQVYAKQIKKKAPKGTWFLNETQVWVQK
jgi:uncharacterized protein YdbL (DUF1318 family)